MPDVDKPLCVRELRIQYAALPGVQLPAGALTTPKACAAIFSQLLEEEACEVFMIACLTARLKLIAVHTVSRGDLNTTLVHPREVFKAALLANAASIVTAHNHPSGDHAPSPEDQSLWTRLNDAGILLGVPCLDHLVIGAGGRYHSEIERKQATAKEQT